MTTFTLHHGDCLEVMATLPDNSIDCCVTSPPYWGLRDYGTATWTGGDPACDHVAATNAHGGERANRNQEGYKQCYRDVCGKCGAVRHDSQLGLEATPEAYVERLVAVFREVRRVLKPGATLWLNLGDSYAANGTMQKGAHKGLSAASERCDGNPRNPDNKAAQNGSIASVARTMPDGLKPKDLVGIPWRVAFALQADGWWLRQDIIWHKPNPMPESVTDRCTKAHEYIFLLTKSARYYYDAEAVSEASSTPAGQSWKVRKEQGGTSGWRESGKFNNAARQSFSNLGNGTTRNRRSVWTITTKPYSGAHFATMPPDLAELCILAGCPVGGTVLDPFAGSGTTLAVAVGNGRYGVGIELNASYIELAKQRISKVRLPLLAMAAD